MYIECICSPLCLCAGKFSLVPLNMAIYIFHKFCRLLLVSCFLCRRRRRRCAHARERASAMDVYLLYSLSFQHRHHLRFSTLSDLLAVQIFNGMRLFYQHACEFRSFEWLLNGIRCLEGTPNWKKGKKEICTLMHLQDLSSFCRCSFHSFILCAYAKTHTQHSVRCGSVQLKLRLSPLLSFTLNIQQFDYY